MAEHDAAAVSAIVLSWWDWIQRAIAIFNIRLEQPLLTYVNASVAARSAIKLYDSLMKTYVRLDPMDGLQIVYGIQVGASVFVSFDEAWKTATAIEVRGQ